jgi:glucose/arabinose dehydrogenase
MVRRIMQAAIIGLMASACQAKDQPGATVVSESGAKPFTETAISEFSSPWAIDFLPGSGVPLTSSALISEKEGKLWLVNVDTGQKQEVAGVPAVHAAGQGGLGDVVAHPEFASNRRIYLTYIESAGDTSGAVMGYGTLSVGQGQPRIENFKVIWRQAPKVSGNGHFSHRIAFGPDGLLYLTSGDRQKMTPAQDMGGMLGKVLRLTPEGQPAPGNPWAADGGVAAQFWSIGHRNLLGLAFAPDGKLWESEMGPRGGDEVNLVLPGKNYGWPRASNGSHYDGAEIPDHAAGDGFEPPKIWWTPSISPGGLMIYNGDLWPQWKGDAFVPALSGKALIRIDLDGDRAAKADHWEMGERIRAAEQGPGGAIYLLEDKGRLLKLTPAK